MSKTSRNLRAFSWGKFSWTEIICVKKLTFCNSAASTWTLPTSSFVIALIKISLSTCEQVSSIRNPSCTLQSEPSVNDPVVFWQVLRPLGENCLQTSFPSQSASVWQLRRALQQVMMRASKARRVIDFATARSAI